ncbi:hypothetical protein CAPTEDRAFT_39192, partial [Capitella teleta]
IGDKEGRSALHLACATGKDYLVKCLLKNGADIDYRDNEGNSSLVLTLINLKDETVLERIVDLLIENGADVNISGHHGNTPLHCASREGMVWATKKLLDNEAELK